MTDTFIETLRAYCRDIDYPRSSDDIFMHLINEVDELDYEISPDDAGPGPDGIFGESIDIILCAFDLIFKNRPDVTNEEIVAYAIKKLEKWKAKYNT